MNKRRAKLMRAVHAEAKTRSLDHDALHDICRQKFNVTSMSDMSEAQLRKLYRDWTGRTIARPLPSRGYGKQGELEIVSGKDLELLERAFARRCWGPETKREFIRRQLGGKEQIRTRREFWKVFSGVRAMNRRDGL
jgi:hypothetical protein